MNSTIHYRHPPSKDIPRATAIGSTWPLPLKAWSCTILPFLSWSMQRTCFESANRHGSGQTYRPCRSHRSSYRVMMKSAARSKLCFVGLGILYGRCPRCGRLCFGMAERTMPARLYIAWIVMTIRPSHGVGHGTWR